MDEGRQRVEGATLFDVYMVVDWSARSRPSPARPTRDALWVAEHVPGERGAGRASETYWPTRAACRAFLRDRLLRHVDRGRRVLLGYDFALGYPAGFAAALGLRGSAPAWRLIWDEVADLVLDDPANGNNRFAVAAQLNRRCGGAAAGPFWGCPPAHAGPDLAPTSPVYPFEIARGRSLARWRRTDRAARGVQPVWKLYGRGSVGGQTLLGIPVVAALRDDPHLSPVSKVWPFETGLAREAVIGRDPGVLHVELWPGLVPLALDTTLAIRDQAQVRATARWLASLDQGGELAMLLRWPPGQAGAATPACVAEEGWILGAGERLTE